MRVVAFVEADHCDDLRLLRRRWTGTRALVRSARHRHDGDIRSFLQAASEPHRSTAERCVYRARSVNRGRWTRSEEHTSELPSLMRISYADFCLKNNILTTIHTAA